MKVKSGREDEILAAAARIFREKGYHGTSVRDIAEAVGLLKGSLYHYIRSKDELLARLFEGLLEDTVRELGSIVARDASPEARLRDMVRAYADAVMAHHDAVGLYLREWRSLPPAELAGLGARRRRMRALLTDVIDDGVRAGGFAVGDAKIAALAILGSCNWLYEWYRPGGRLSRAAIADELAERAVRSVRA
ncbi:MAG TPA: TetR/AcrR family transcriptional regulator [Chloroflexi bacterium]|jgi:AcrR family transcriptional regulator|nr:TetR/AcrR family transcriptional regulator [Chloroflexota bacterium]HAL28404.1 TetR/AcrR family transcriptional regulator [Chloroflexota bacterium]